MTSNRIERLYKQKLVKPDVGHKTLPLAHILKKAIIYFPEKPKKLEFDILEIGPGNGEFLLNLAQNHPNQKFLAVEIGSLRFKKIKSKIEKLKLENLTLVHGDARVVFYNELADHSIGKCFVLFPDPWPKNKHRHRRLLQQDFLKLIALKLKPGGFFILATDVADYATWTLDHLEQIPDLKNALGKKQMAKTLDEIPPTYFSKKWQKIGREFNYVKFAKVGK